MTARWYEMIVTSSLYNVGDGSAIDLKIENYVPSEVWDPHHDQTPTRLSGGGFDRDCANKNKNEKESDDGGKS